MIESDFSVDFILEQGGLELFCALRKGGAETIRTLGGRWQTHVMGVWHFVLNQSVQEANFTRNQISQWHIPRYAMAVNLERLTRASEAGWDAPRPLLAHLGEGLSLAMFKRNQLSFDFGPVAASGGLKKAFQNKLKKELGFLEIAREEVQAEGESFVLPDVRTPGGHPVNSPSRELVEAIAFEKAVLGRLDAAEFGIFSAYCTQVDFDTPRRMPIELIRSLVASLNENGDALWELASRTEKFLKVQELLFSKPIWGPKLRVAPAEAEQILADAMASLTRSKRVQFVLMEGMHGAGLLLPLSVVSGLMSFEEYASIVCRYFQPDAPEEQDRRKETAYIKLFGEFAGN